MKNRSFYSVPLEPDEITPKALYQTRRQFMKQISVVGLGALLASCAPGNSEDSGMSLTGLTDITSNDPADILTPYETVSGFCNYYEFTTYKEGVGKMAQSFVTQPWSVQVDGLVDQPRTFSMEEILSLFTQEARIYRMRCVEGWSMVIPWTGFPLWQLLDMVQPQSTAQYVAFETALAPNSMEGIHASMFSFPYLEGLRLDEARHDLTILATGLYDESLPPQNGAPIRLVVPWKYGFKSIKSIIRISLVAEQPPTFWNAYAPNEYGFYANVNPEVDHPRWSQAAEHRIGETGRRDTLFMNGYAEEVMPLYEGMDLHINF